MKSFQIAIVDDDQGFACALGHFLNDKGFEVNTYASGAEAVGAWTSAEPLVAVVDANLPDMHGTEVIERLHACRPDVPVLMVTGDATLANIGRCRRSDIDRVLLKPVNPDHFYAAIKGLVDRRGLKP